MMILMRFMSRCLYFADEDNLQVLHMRLVLSISIIHYCCSLYTGNSLDVYAGRMFSNLNNILLAGCADLVTGHLMSYSIDGFCIFDSII